MTAEPSPLHPRARPLSDAGNAERLIDRHGADLRYVPAWGTWLTWSGTHWARDEDGEIVRRCTDTIRAMADEVRRAPDDKTAAKVAAHAMRCEAAARLDAMERLARSHLDVVTGVDQLDDRPWLLACANGTVDLRTGTLRPAARDDLLTRRCPVEHDLDAACLRWETFLAEVLPDPDVRSLVQRAVGYSLTGDVSEHRMLVCHGRGANGKALDDDTPVPTPDGWIRHGDLTIGDVVLNADGAQIAVRAIGTSVTTGRAYEVVTSDGGTVVAHENHEWEVVDDRGHTLVMTTRQMFERGTRRDGHRRRPFTLPSRSPLELPERALPIDPYLFGAWLGDGTSNSAEITLGERKAPILAAFELAGHEIRPRNRPRTHGIGGGFKAALRSLGVLGGKSKLIPMSYLRASRDQRIALLQGLMDTDGFCSNGQGQCEIVQTHRPLVEGVSELLDTLAVTHTVRESRTTIAGIDKGPRWRILFTPSFEVFRHNEHNLLRQRDRLARRTTMSPRAVSQSRVTVTTIRPAPMAPMRCIEVDDPRGVYLAGPRMTPTHNSVMVETLRAVLGDHMQQLPGDSLLVRSGDRVNNDIARLPGVRMATLVEVNEARELDSALVKQLTGGDAMTARHLYRDYFEFRLQAKAWMIVNHKPGVRGDDEGLWRRLLLIPFDVVIPPERRDRGLGERLRGELPGILAWAVRGCLAWQRDGLGSAARVDDATRQYRVESDVVGAFLDERCTLGGPSAWTSAAAAYDAWSRWCGEQGERPRSQRWLTIQLTERGVQRQRQGHAGARGFAGLHVDQGPI